jgi:hypothetical protein
VISPAVTVGSGIDSSDYNNVVEAYNELLDAVIKAYESDTTRIPGVVYVCPPKDSARIIKNFLKSFRPPAIVRRDTVKVEVTSLQASATIEQQRTEIITLRAENQKALADKDEAVGKLQNKNKQLAWWILGIVAAFGAGWVVRTLKK